MDGSPHAPIRVALQHRQWDDHWNTDDQSERHHTPSTPTIRAGVPPPRSPSPSTNRSPRSRQRVKPIPSLEGSRSAVLQNLTAGVVVGTWEVHPSLPTGFHFNAGNGTITGTPSGNQSAITYTIYANTTGGSDAATVVLTVNEPAPVLSPASQTHTLTRNSTFGHIEQNHSGGVVNTWAIHPSLPAGLTLHSGNGNITGTPTVNLSASTYTLYANNTGGTGTATLTLTITEQAPVLSPSSQSHTLTKDASMGAILINSTAGTVSTWAIHPACPRASNSTRGMGQSLEPLTTTCQRPPIVSTGTTHRGMRMWM